MDRAEIWPGQPYPLGATWDGAGTNFAVFSEQAERVELCLFDEAGKEMRITLPEMSGYVWHGYIPDIDICFHEHDFWRRHALEHGGVKDRGGRAQFVRRGYFVHDWL